MLIGVGAVILLVGLVAAWGAALPRTHVASSAITLQQPPDSVWAVIRDLGSVPTWWRDVKQSTRLPDEGGKELLGAADRHGADAPFSRTRSSECTARWTPV